MLRKINSFLIIPIILLLISHVVLMAGLLTGTIGFNPDFKIFSKLLLPLVLLHALFGICFMIERIVKKKRGQNTYPKPNTIFRLQMLSGIAMLILVFLHVTAYGYTNAEGVFILRDPSLFYYITESLFALSICVHCAVSFPRMAITFGLIQEGRGMLKLLKTSMILFSILFFVIFAVFSLYYLPPVIGGMV